MKCSECVYAIPTRRKYGVTYHCDKEVTHMDVTYYTNEKHKNEENLLCPLLKRADNEVLNYGA